MKENSFVDTEPACLSWNTKQIGMQQHLGGEENYDDEIQVVEMLKRVSVNWRMGKPADPMPMCKLNFCVQQIANSKVSFWATASPPFK